MRKGIVIGAVLGLLACGLVACSGLGLDVQDGVPVITDPDNLHAVDDIVNPGIGAVADNAPANPADLTGWIVALVTGLGAAGAAAAKYYLGKRKKD